MHWTKNPGEKIYKNHHHFIYVPYFNYFTERFLYFFFTKNVYRRSLKLMPLFTPLYKWLIIKLESCKQYCFVSPSHRSGTRCFDKKKPNSFKRWQKCTQNSFTYSLKEPKCCQIFGQLLLHNFTPWPFKNSKIWSHCHSLARSFESQQNYHFFNNFLHLKCCSRAMWPDSAIF